MDMRLGWCFPFSRQCPLANLLAKARVRRPVSIAGATASCAPMRNLPMTLDSKHESLKEEYEHENSLCAQSADNTANATSQANCSVAEENAEISHGVLDLAAGPALF